MSKRGLDTQVVQPAEVADIRRLSQEGEPDHVLQGLPAGHVRVPQRELLLRVVHRVRARVQETGHSTAALAEIDQVSNRLGPAVGIGAAWPAFALNIPFRARIAGEERGK